MAILQKQFQSSETLTIYYKLKQKNSRVWGEGDQHIRAEALPVGLSTEPSPQSRAEAGPHGPQALPMR